MENVNIVSDFANRLWYKGFLFKNFSLETRHKLSEEFSHPQNGWIYDFAPRDIKESRVKMKKCFAHKRSLRAT
jgi:hypothetical protein